VVIAQEAVEGTQRSRDAALLQRVRQRQPLAGAGVHEREVPLAARGDALRQRERGPGGGRCARARESADEAAARAIEAAGSWPCQR
jgi:hypothetical protein